MREILFRGKRLDNGGWIEGDLRQYPSGAAAIRSDKIGSTIKVDPATVGQYTGLKDVADNRIFEGDIIEWDPVGTMYGVVEFDEGGFCANKHFLNDGLYCGCFEGLILGNIHDDPDLIERSEIK